MELEDGELEDSGNEEPTEEKHVSFSFHDAANNYRSQNSDDSLDGSDSDPGYEGGQSKRGKLSCMQLSPVKKAFKNPLTKGSDMKNWTDAIDNQGDFWNRGLASAQAASKGLKCKNNVWGDVMGERELSDVIRSTTTGDWKPSMENERNVESYDYKSVTIVQNDEHSELCANSSKPTESMEEPVSSDDNACVVDALLDRETFGKKFYKPKAPRKRSVKDRLSKKNSNLDMSLDDIVQEQSINIRPPTHIVRPAVFDRLGSKEEITTENTDDEIIQHIVDTLQEENLNLVVRIVHVIGKEIALGLMEQTMTVEQQGGMMTLDNRRRRSPGGVYIQLIKQCDGVTKDQKRTIFFADQRLVKKAKRKKKSNTESSIESQIESIRNHQEQQRKTLESSNQEKNSTDQIEETGDKEMQPEKNSDNATHSVSSHSSDKYAVRSSTSARLITSYDDLDFGDAPEMDIILD